MGPLDFVLHFDTHLTEFVASVSPDMPWHVTAFHGDYKMDDTPNTTAEMLQQAAVIGRRTGLRFVYAGNLPGAVGSLEDTHCASCDATLVARSGYRIRDYRITSNGCCPSCGSAVPGRFDAQFAQQVSTHPSVIRLQR